MKKYVDFHLHSIKSRAIGDSIGWFSLANTLMQLNNQKIKAFAFSDHDMFVYDFYKEVQKEIIDNNYDMIVFPAVEITIKRVNGNKGHIVVIFDNKTSDMDLQELEYIIAETKNDYGVGIDKFFKAIKNYQYVAIPHIGKSDYLIYEDLKNHLDLFKYVEVSNSKVDMYNRFCKESNTNIPYIYFSDTHYWDNHVYVKPNVYVEDNVELTFESIFNNLKME